MSRSYDDAGDVVHRFSNRADDYDRYRPSYPPAAIDAILVDLAEPANLRILDVGAGTGIATRLLVDRGARVIGIEPNGDMRDLARERNLDVRAGTATATGITTASIDVVASFQAFHWFADREALAEFQRVLRPGGRVALVWNNRSQMDPFTRGYHEIIARYGDYAKVELLYLKSEQIVELLRNAGMRDLRLQAVVNRQSLDLDGLLGRVRSSSYAPREGPDYERLAAEMSALHARFADEADQVALVYDTEIFLGTRPA